MISFSILAIMFLLIALLVFGLVQSKKHSFKAGFYFFLILIINEFYSFFAPLIAKSILDNFILNDSQPMGMSGGELASLISLIPKTIEIFAFIILLVGLNRMWRAKNVQT